MNHFLTRLISCAVVFSLMVGQVSAAALIRTDRFTPTLSTVLLTQTLSAPGNVFRHPTSFTAEAGLRTASLSRRDVLKKTGLVAGLFRWSAPISAWVTLLEFSWHAHAANFKVGVGSIDEQPVHFSAYDAASAEKDVDLQKVLTTLDDFMDNYRRMGQARALMNDDPVFSNFENVQYHFALSLYVIPSFQTALLRHMQEIGIPFSKSAREQMNQILYAGLPSYLAHHGLFLNIAFPSLRNKEEFHPGLDNVTLTEHWVVYPVASVEHRTLSLWGQPVAMDELTIDHVFKFHGRSLAPFESPAVLAGLMIHQTLVIFSEGIAESVLAEKTSYTRYNPNLLTLSKLEWEDVALSPQARKNPLEFSHNKMRIYEIEHPRSDAARTLSELTATRYHERQHFLNLRKRLYLFLPVTAPTWEAYDSTVNKDHVADETSAKIAEARHVPAADRHGQLLQMIVAVLLPTVPRLERIKFFNLLDLLITHLSAQTKNYPELKIFSGIPLSIRLQVVGQLYRLTPESLGRAWEAVHVYFEAHPHGVKMLEKVDPAELWEPSVQRAA